jgi:hypothetical protein
MDCGEEQEDDKSAPSWVGQLFSHVRRLFSVSAEAQERRRDYEAEVESQMYQHFSETMPNVEHPPIFALFDIYTCQRVARSDYSVSRYGDVEQPHMASGVYSSAKLIADLVQIRLGIKEYAEYPAYNLEGTGDKMRSRFLFFEVIPEGAVRIGAFPYMKYARYFVLYSEIVETGELDSFGLAPLSALSLHNSSGDSALQRKEALACTNKFIKSCQIEMMGHSGSSGRGVLPYTCNGFIGSLESCRLVDKHDSATFEYPPPIPGKDAESIEFLRTNIASQAWFISPSNNRYLLKCSPYPFLCDLHGNPIEPKSSTDMFYIVVQCIRPKLCVCPFCGKGEDGEFASSAINETLTKDEILKLNWGARGQMQAIGSPEFQKHLAECPIAARVVKPGDWAKSGAVGDKLSCFACKQKFKDTREWFNHCQQRTCIINTVNFLINGSKRKRTDSGNSEEGGGCAASCSKRGDSQSDDEKAEAAKSTAATDHKRRRQVTLGSVLF